jgi:hypothetical protein
MGQAERECVADKHTDSESSLRVTNTAYPLSFFQGVEYSLACAKFGRVCTLPFFNRGVPNREAKGSEENGV